MVVRMSPVNEKTGIRTNARKTQVRAWRTMVFTRHRLIGSQDVESSRSHAISAANPAKLKDNPATVVKKNCPSIMVR